MASPQRCFVSAVVLGLAGLCQPAIAQPTPPIMVDERTFMDIVHAPRAVGVAAGQRERLFTNLQAWKTYYRASALCALVVGHSDTVESTVRKELADLSNRRTATVTSLLLRYGFTGAQVQTYSAGPDKPVHRPPSLKNLRTEVEVFPCPG
jgi:hypothetical protein